ncbi:cytochrome P450 family 150 subfamily A5 [Frankia sp. AiPs1]|uniref:cytochrome P450 n=1 Tax=Frankia sp. AiPa1 TaxID=573492 RepID=UPI00202B89CE|nr:cytochrome P450 [Frankia sp. AiPa1]MCL9760074.1 cytochrome P450 [Frankia sp. AiPa1]
MTDLTAVDYFNDPSLNDDPYPYYDALRAKCPVLPLPELGVVAVSGYQEITEVYRDPANYSSINSVIGPYATFPVPLEGDDITPLIEKYRDQIPMNEHLVTMDPPSHTQGRTLVMGMLTPKRLRENEEFIWGLADRQLDAILAQGKCEFIREFAQPFAMLTVADLLGVPQADHERFRQGFGLSQSPGQIGAGGEGGTDADGGLNALSWLDDWFSRYIEDRRETPTGDVLTQMATATYPDGTVPSVDEVVRAATFLFAAGQETTARLLASAVKYLGDNPDVQARVREHRELIPELIEETLRVESPVKTDFRLAKRNMTLAGVDLPAGTPVMLLNSAANRDPEQFECPAEFRLGRENVRSHIAFGRGVHTCPGGPLARVEARISLERLFDRTTDIRISEEHHGPAGDRHYDYEPTWILRGLTKLHVEFDLAEGEGQ